MKIGFVSADWSDILDDTTGLPTLGGAGWYRVGMPCEYLNAAGVEAVAVEQISTGADGEIWLHGWDRSTHDDCDVIVFQRWMRDDAPEVIRRARACGQVIVNDVDDWYWGLDRRNQAYKLTDPKLNPKSNIDHYWKVLEASDAITVSTPFLFEKLAKMPGEVFLIRNAIDLKRWPDPVIPRVAPKNVGWVGSTAHRSGDLETLRGIVGPFVERNDLRFVHAGHHRLAPPAGELALVPESRWDNYPMVPIVEYQQLISHIDLGLVPLNDVPFNHAKSAIKGMEYAAAGIPFVAQRTPEYEWLSNEMAVGRTARKPKEWVRELDRLMDRDQYQIDATINRVMVEKLDMANKVQEWISTYEHLLP